MQQIVCISDTHCTPLPDLPEGNILLHCGDLTKIGTLPEFQEAFEEISRQSEKFDYVVVIAGNHDFLFEENPELVEKSMNDIIGSKVHYIQNETKQIGPLKIFGSPVSIPYHDWAFNWGEDKRKSLYSSIPEDIDVVDTHSPPQGILDKPYPTYYKSLGCPFLRKEIFRSKPRLHAFGHIHGGYGRASIEGIEFVNAALLDENYDLTNGPIIVNIRE